MTHTEGSIQEMLDKQYRKTAKYVVHNVFVFGYGETDTFVLQQSSGYCYDIEIKVSRSDFKHDFTKREKHDILSIGGYYCSHTEKIDGKWVSVPDTKLTIPKRRPNRFYYCVPEGMITKDDVPSYAGLMYATEDSTKIIKEAPFIHKEKLNFDNVLCEKFYYYWRGVSTDYRMLLRQYNKIKEKYLELQPQEANWCFDFYTSKSGLG